MKQRKNYPEDKVIELLNSYGNLQRQAIMLEQAHPINCYHFGRGVLRDIEKFKNLASPELQVKLELSALEKKANQYISIYIQARKNK